MPIPIPLTPYKRVPSGVKLPSVPSQANTSMSPSHLIAVFRNMRTLPSQRLLRNAFFASVNHNYGDSKRTLKNRNKQNGSKSTNHSWEAWPFDPVKANWCFLRGPLVWLTAAKNVFRSSRWLEQSSHDSENRSNLIGQLSACSWHNRRLTVSFEAGKCESLFIRRTPSAKRNSFP